jgi:tetratricopeptide (TPR) repeat protein
MAIPDLQEAIDLIENGQAEEAIASLTAWAQQQPAHAAAHVVLARAYEAGAQWEEAQAAWQRAYFLMPNSPAVHEGLERVRAAVAEREAVSKGHLIMDLDLQAELEATLETLFNPFTLSQQSQGVLKTDPTVDDLERLISELEAARIVPHPDLEDIPPPELDDEIDDVVSETLARIYASQKKYGEAARVYEQLAHQQPEEAPKFLQLAAEMHDLAGNIDDGESRDDED